jgi:acyl-coenzyme A thioesterase PaaI-like protein
MKAVFKLIDKLIAHQNPASLMALDKLLTVGIPFNAPHGFKIRQLDPDSVLISLPNRKLNHNHLGGIHACAMATVGEYCAGLALLQCFGISKYRLIMSELSVKYTYQGRVDLEGSCSPRQIDQSSLQLALEQTGSYNQTLTTLIREKKSGKEVAVVTTSWQLKAWEQVQTGRV